MIIVEGCDNAGKTTLVQALSDELKLLTILNRRRPRSLQQSWDYLIRVMPAASFLPTIMDRFMAISEPIYGPICRNEALYKWDDIRAQFEFVRTCIKGSPMIVYCRPPDERILNFGERPQMEGVIANAPTLMKYYDGQIGRIRDELPVIVVRYDYTQPNAYQDLLQVASVYIQETYQ